MSWSTSNRAPQTTGVKELNAIVGRGHGFDTVKPLMLFEKIIQLWCPPGGIVMDPFAGSLTTGPAVLDLNPAKQDRPVDSSLSEQGRPERGDPYASSLTANRLKRVITGDWGASRQTHTARRRFSYPSGLTNGSMPKRSSLWSGTRWSIPSSLPTSTPTGSGARISSESTGEEWVAYLLAKNSENEGFFLVWDGPDKNTDFTASVYEACATEAEEAGLKPIYHVYARLNLFQTEDVRFYQIPDRILTDFGLDMTASQLCRDPSLSSFSSFNTSRRDDGRAVQPAISPIASSREPIRISGTSRTFKLSRRSRRRGRRSSWRRRWRSILHRFRVPQIFLWLSKGRVVVEQTLANLLPRQVPASPWRCRGPPAGPITTRNEVAGPRSPSCTSQR